jgi:hypothetical protein
MIFTGKSEKELRHLIVDAVAEYFMERPFSGWYVEDNAE